MTATPMLNAAAVVANHACFRHQPSFLASRRLRRISCANAFLRGLTVEEPSTASKADVEPPAGSVLVFDGASVPVNLQPLHEESKIHVLDRHQGLLETEQVMLLNRER
jgi:hypothetical protein